MSEQRQHPDVFTEDDALVYLHVAGIATDRTMETLRKEHRLPFFSIGKATLYHRTHLDALVSRLASVEHTTQRSLKIVGN